ncbi:hypothetical protein GWA97_00615 [Flavobacterium sp. LaA7.5]|nr:hypothetical protein [Flavobacterium salilacus subsp. altitudinum]
MIAGVKKKITDNIKNIKGWKTNRKIVVFSVDDYGNVRLASKHARENLDKAGMPAKSRFDKYDTLETKEDLEHLFDVLTSVKDKHGNPAVFTPFALPANIDFEKVIENNYDGYYYELLPQTLAKLPGYEKVWDLWQEGIKNRLLLPQFHGREHLNLKVFNELLSAKDPQIITALQNRSYTSIDFKKYPSISYTAAFDFDKFEENETFKDAIVDGLDVFEKVFGYRAIHFNPPGGRENPVLHPLLFEKGIKILDTPSDKKEHLGNGQYKKVFNYMGKENGSGQLFMIRNAVFEPTQDNSDWVAMTMQQIATAFRWKKPAVISSHRVNFCGLIDEKNRQDGLQALRQLLQQIVKRWPDVEFMAANELGELILSDKNV